MCLGAGGHLKISIAVGVIKEKKEVIRMQGHQAPAPVNRGGRRPSVPGSLTLRRRTSDRRVEGEPRLPQEAPWASCLHHSGGPKETDAAGRRALVPSPPTTERVEISSPHPRLTLTPQRLKLLLKWHLPAMATPAPPGCSDTSNLGCCHLKAALKRREKKASQ